MSYESEWDVKQVVDAIASLEEARFIIDTMLSRRPELMAVSPSIKKRLTEATDSAFNAIVVLNWTLDEMEEAS